MATYTCPMHPDVTTDHPSTCPRCGMRLVQREVTTPPTSHRTGKRQPTRER